MSLEMLKITHEQSVKDVYSGTIKALFNPNQLTFSTDVTWEVENVLYLKKRDKAWKTRYTSTAPTTLNLNLFFDTYEEAGQLKGSIWSLLFAPPSVLTQTTKLTALARCQNDLHRPPKCILYWGKRTLFFGVITSVKEVITLFLDDGTPVRATVDCTFKEVADDSTSVESEFYSPDVEKTYVVRPGDTLNRIAAQLYDDPSRWRFIAEANNIDNPRVLTPGQVLLIPKLV